MTIDSTDVDLYVNITWEKPSDDFDLFVYRGRLDKGQNPPNGTDSGDFGELLAGSSRRTGSSEKVTIAGERISPGAYTVRVIYLHVADSAYRGTASLRGDATGVQCTPDHVWFLGIVYDKAQRDDFKEDVRHFEAFLARLRETYCIPESQATILAMEDGYTDRGKTYAEASEANLKNELGRMGEESESQDDAQFFFFLSSHGLMGAGAADGMAVDMDCEPARVGSFAGLKAGGGENGFLDDCELGDSLNESFSDVTRMLIAVDCSFCGGFSDSLTAVSGTVPDGGVVTSSGVPGPNRIVVTGCAITTECFGSTDTGGVFYRHMRRVLDGEIACDGWTAPGFPEVQGFNLPVNGPPFSTLDGRC
ncbi:MAG: hypothetical protein ACRDI3_00075, partial [Actinomycetota bacterium]